MSHVVIELFVKVVPTDLFRLGTKNSPQLHKLRTMPPRTLDQAFDIEIYERNGAMFVSKDSGGISTFDKKQSFGGLFQRALPFPVGCA